MELKSNYLPIAVVDTGNTYNGAPTTPPTVRAGNGTPTTPPTVGAGNGTPTTPPTVDTDTSHSGSSAIASNEVS